MKSLVLILIIILTFSVTLPESLQQEKLQEEKSNEIILSDNELILVFLVSISIVVGIFLYLARHLFSRKKDEYQKGTFDSQKNRDYEKYHSDWTSDDYRFDTNNKKDDEEFKKSLQNSSLPNYYEILGVPKDATHQDIKIRFRSLAKEWHPDKNKGKVADKKMIEINKAYEVLSDDKRRKSYDKFLSIS
jgi:hypothetical protein